MTLAADTFIVTNKTVINNTDLSILLNLYQPLVGNEAISLYYTLWSYLDKTESISNEWTHNHLLTNMQITISEIDDARVKLEAMGLLKTYKKEGNINSYIYEMYSPMSASEFINNPVLASALYNRVGKLEYEKIISFYKIPSLNLREYTEITKNFSDVFGFYHGNINDNLIYDLKKSRYRHIEILSKIELNTILNLIPDELLNKKSINKSMKDYIYNISYIYNYDNDDMVSLIRNSINDMHRIDKKLLRENAEKYYSFEHLGKLPSLIYKNQPEYLRKKQGDNSNRSRMIYMFETTSPYDFISSKYKKGNPTATDLKIIAHLLLDLELKPGVVNVLIDYVLKVNNNRLVKSYVDTIASQWSRSNIETVEDAMSFAEAEYKRMHKSKPKNNKTIKKEEKPDWFNQSIEENTASLEEIKALEARIGSR